MKTQQDTSIDAVITFDVIEHFGKSELLQLADEVKRVLRVGGCWIIHTPNAESPFGGRIRYGDFTHEIAFTRGSIYQLLRTIGFSSIKSHEDRPIIHGIFSFMRYILWRSIRILLRFYIIIENGVCEKDAIFSQNFLTIATRD